jgi:hypothetical protein
LYKLILFISIVVITAFLVLLSLSALNFNTSFFEVAVSGSLLLSNPPVYINKDITRAAIANLKEKQFDPEVRESDYILITALLLYNYFPYSSN